MSQAELPIDSRFDPNFDKDKYIRIAKTEGVNAALTALHRDTTGWEYETFEGQAGYQPEMFKKLIDVRAFSRELWELALKAESASS